MHHPAYTAYTAATAATTIARARMIEAENAHCSASDALSLAEEEAADAARAHMPETEKERRRTITELRLAADAADAAAADAAAVFITARDAQCRAYLEARAARAKPNTPTT